MSKGLCHADCSEIPGLINDETSKICRKDCLPGFYNDAVNPDVCLNCVTDGKLG